MLEETKIILNNEIKNISLKSLEKEQDF